MRKVVPVFLFFMIIIFNAFKSPYSSGQAPSGYNGEFGFNCSSCHSDFAVNSGGGSVVVTGLPTVGGYQPGVTYPISVTITHGTADRLKWGFSIAARNQLGSDVGVFNPGPNTALINGNAELGHSPAPATPASNSYTFTGISWTAPSVPTSDDVNINVYLVGNATNDNSSNSGDYIYTAVRPLSLPIVLNFVHITKTIDNKVQLNWQTAQETNSSFFEIQKSKNGLQFQSIGSIDAAGNSSFPKDYTFTDLNPGNEDKKIYYRLKQVDLNGSFYFSKVLPINLNKPSVFISKVYPNPVFSNTPVQIQISSTEKTTVLIQMVSNSGAILYGEKISLNLGENYISLPLKATWLGTGTGFIRIKNGAEQQSLPVFIF